MRALLAGGALACLAVAAGCPGDHPQDPCDPAAAGAPWLALGSAEAGSWDVQVIRADGSCRRAVASGPSFDLGPAWGPAGQLAFDSDRAPGLGIWVHDLRTGTTRRLDTGALLATSPAFSPDGAAIAFEGRTSGSAPGAVYAVPAAGGAPVLLTPEASPHGNGGPAYSPDGQTVYFVSNRTGPYEVHAVPAAGGEAVQVTAGSRIIGKAAVSPDGARLAFARLAGSSTEVVLLDLASGDVAPLGVAGASEPAWDPRGGRLAVRVVHGSSSRIALVPLDGASPHDLTPGPGPDGAPAFAP